MKKNIYAHKIRLDKVVIKNKPREEFRELLEGVEYIGYEVETLEGGKKIIITKPGGKFTFGRLRKEDFIVWVYDPKDSSLWSISHKDIYNDLVEKGKSNPKETIKILTALEEVYNGDDPEDILNSTQLSNPCGESPDLLLKAYKWIWGQEDCNYPTGKGRAMSWEGWKKNEKGEWVKTNKGILDIKKELQTQVDEVN